MIQLHTIQFLSVVVLSSLVITLHDDAKIESLASRWKDPELKTPLHRGWRSDDKIDAMTD